MNKPICNACGDTGICKGNGSNLPDVACHCKRKSKPTSTDAATPWIVATKNSLLEVNHEGAAKLFPEFVAMPLAKAIRAVNLLQAHEAVAEALTIARNFVYGDSRNSNNQSRADLAATELVRIDAAIAHLAKLEGENK